MIAEIISIGDELLIGQITNTNAAFIATELNNVGIRVKRMVTVGDKREDILHALHNTHENTNLIILTGGLGPTSDDITKSTICEYFNSHLVLHQESLEDITRLFHSRGMEVSKLNRKQAELPNNCRPIQNPVGTAPGMWFEKRQIHTISMPGVPFEMKKMLLDEVLPELNKLTITLPFVHKTLLTIGMGESALADHIKKWEQNLSEDVKLAYLPEPGIVKLRLSCYRSKNGDPHELIDQEITKLKDLIPDLIFGYGKDTLQSVAGNLLKRHHKSVSTAESCTGGYIAHLITSVPGSSEYFKGSVIAYDNAVKINTLGVNEKLILKHGAVSQDVVSEMAARVRTLLNTDYAIATSGIAGPDGGTREKPVGTTWIAIASKDKVIAEKFLLGEDRERNIRRASLFALNMLRKELESTGSQNSEKPSGKKSSK